MRPLPRVTLRPYEDADTGEKSRAVRESAADLSPWMPWCRPGYSSEDASAWIRRSREGRAEGSLHDFAILDADGTYAGGCSVNRINRTDRCANLSYWVRSSRAGGGIATAAVLQLIAWTFANTTLNRLEIVVAEGNAASRRVAERAGARREGVLRKRLMVGGRASSAILYAVLRPDEAGGHAADDDAPDAGTGRPSAQA